MNCYFKSKKYVLEKREIILFLIPFCEEHIHVFVYSYQFCCMTPNCITNPSNRMLGSRLKAELQAFNTRTERDSCLSCNPATWRSGLEDVMDLTSFLSSYSQLEKSAPILTTLQTYQSLIEVVRNLRQAVDRKTFRARSSF